MMKLLDQYNHDENKDMLELWSELIELKGHIRYDKQGDDETLYISNDQALRYELAMITEFTGMLLSTISYVELIQLER